MHDNNWRNEYVVQENNHKNYQWQNEWTVKIKLKSKSQIVIIQTSHIQYYTLYILFKQYSYKHINNLNVQKTWLLFLYFQQTTKVNRGLQIHRRLFIWTLSSNIMMIGLNMQTPFGIQILRLFRRCYPGPWSWDSSWYIYIYRAFILFLTFITYICFHMSRKPITVVKTEILNCTETLVLGKYLNMINSNAFANI